MTDRAGYAPGEDEEYGFETRAVRAGFERSAFGEHTEPVFLTSSFVHDSAAHAAAKFAGEAEGFIYSRFGNPTVRVFEERLAALEGAEDCRATASGMSAIMSVLVSLTRSGDHVVCSQGVFGTTMQLFALFARYGIETSYVPLDDPAAWEAAIRPNTRLLFLETPSNPMADVFDIAAIAEMARKVGATFAVDNCFCTPVLQRPLALGADVVIHSASKHLDGQGRVMGGAIVGTKEMCRERVYNFLRTTGASLAPFNAWVILKGMETLPIRMRAHSENALALAEWLAAHPKVANVNYPFLASHPSVALAKRQQSGGGAVLSFNVKGGKTEAWKVVDAVKIMSITGNLGDVKTTITHPATTTHGRMTQAARDAAGIGDALIRVAVGLEAQDDLRDDLARGLAQI